VSSHGMHEVGDLIQMILEKKGLLVSHHKIEYTKFSNGEILPHIPDTVRLQHVFFLHALQHPDPNTALMMMLLANDALKRASVTGITLVTPYIPYLRQDRKDKPRVPISARMVADLIESNRSVESIITIDMHADQEQGFFSIPVDNLSGTALFADHFKGPLEAAGGKVVAVSPDFGGAVRTRRFAARLGDIPVAIIEKNRPGPNQSRILSVIGESVEGASVIIFEDMIDTGGTLLKTAAKLTEMGATNVFLTATHGILSGDAESKFAASGYHVTCSDSIPRDEDFIKRNPWFHVVSIDHKFADAIYECSLAGGSVSQLES